jgi:hypothetical protein
VSSSPLILGLSAEKPDRDFFPLFLFHSLPDLKLSPLSLSKPISFFFSLKTLYLTLVCCSYAPTSIMISLSILSPSFPLHLWHLSPTHSLPHPPTFSLQCSHLIHGLSLPPASCHASSLARLHTVRKFNLL